MIAGSDRLSPTKRAELRGVISTKPGLNRFLRVTPGGLLRVDAAKITADAKLDRKYLLRTSDPHLSTEDIALGYKHNRHHAHPNHVDRDPDITADGGVFTAAPCSLAAQARARRTVSGAGSPATRLRCSFRCCYSKASPASTASGALHGGLNYQIEHHLFLACQAPRRGGRSRWSGLSAWVTTCPTANPA